MALPANGTLKNPVSEGYFVDYSDQGKTRALNFPSWGFPVAEFPSGLPTVTVTSSAQLMSELTKSDRILQLVPALDFVINDIIPLGENLIVQGAGQSATRITLASSLGTSIKPLEAKYRRYLVFRDLELDSNRQGFISLQFAMCSHVLVERATIHNGGRLLLRLPSSTKWTVRFCDIYDTPSLHCLSAAPESSNASPGTEWPSYFNIYSNRLYGAGPGGHGLDTHCEYGEIAGNYIHSNGDGQSKQPDSYELYVHHNRFGYGSKYGTRTYDAKRGSSPFVYYYANQYDGGYSRADHIGGESNGGSPSFNVWTGNTFGTDGTDDARLDGGNFTVYAETTSTEAGTGLTTAAPQTILDKLSTLRAAEVIQPGDPGTPDGEVVDSPPPYDYSTFITDFKFTDEISSIGAGGDNWPVTHADDDRLYVAGGDWNGFNNAYGTKQSATIGYVTGNPPSIVGTNVAAFEAAGSGRSGRKFSGLLSFDAIFFAWLRNADHDGKGVRLMSSDDHGATWIEHFVFDQFSHMTFVQQGQDYTEAFDSYIYMVSPNGPDAYLGYDGFVLLRCPYFALTNKAAYEYFIGLDTQGNALWSSRIEFRVNVFEHLGRCSRSGIAYNPGVGRFMWWQSHHTASDPKSGFGIYEAEHPWGPWSTVYWVADADSWDRDPGENGHFPTKWMDPAGNYVWALFSGGDSLTVRRATFITPNSLSDGVVDRLIAAASDDAEETEADGSMVLGSSNLDIEAETLVGLRFTNITVPQYATITDARLIFTADSSRGEPFGLKIYCEQDSNPGTFTTNDYDISSRAVGSEYVGWPNIPAWNFSVAYTSPSIQTLVQRQVDREDWASGNALSFQIVGNTGKRTAKTWSNDKTQTVRLYIEYNNPAGLNGHTEHARAVSTVSGSYAIIDTHLSTGLSMQIADRGYGYATILTHISSAQQDLEEYRGLSAAGGSLGYG